MTPEVTVLALAGLLQVAQFLLYSVLANRQVGSRYALGPRDEPRQLTGFAGRAQRALSNHFEGLVLFTIAVVVVTLGGQSTAFTAACAWVYLVARLLYVPAYLFALSPWRSVVWSVGLAATVLMLLAALT
ncbi:MAPEG family protein [Seohaeicola zhoushanensis]|uniref:Membrane protein n=1 Tax=Seohaeicola zhoushanensis TaxID=1569283 RepID=A0A8J3GVA7_9RHOB|nr:MAPEG family protein [Seohaeicola zhoushanensis]GHF38080.1 membrane protein [Seohaeicola zhoushanensis]